MQEDIAKYASVGTVEEVTEAKNRVASLTENAESMTESVSELEEYRKLGTIDDITELTERSDDMISKYESLGVRSPEDLDVLLERCETLLEKYREVGSPEDIKEELENLQEELEEYKDLGTVADINEMCELTEQFIKDVGEIGTLDELNRLLELADRYTFKGSLKEIDAVFERTSLLLETVKESKMEEAAENLARETGSHFRNRFCND